MPILSVRLFDVHHPAALMGLLVHLRASRQCNGVSCEDKCFEIDAIHSSCVSRVSQVLKIAPHEPRSAESTELFSDRFTKEFFFLTSAELDTVRQPFYCTTMLSVCIFVNVKFIQSIKEKKKTRAELKLEQV